MDRGGTVGYGGSVDTKPYVTAVCSGGPFLYLFEVATLANAANRVQGGLAHLRTPFNVTAHGPRVDAGLVGCIVGKGVDNLSTLFVMAASPTAPWRV